MNLLNLFPVAASPTINGLEEVSWSLTLHSIPSIVVKRPPRVPGLSSNSSSGISREAVSAWNEKFQHQLYCLFVFISLSTVHFKSMYKWMNYFKDITCHVQWFSYT